MSDQKFLSKEEVDSLLNMAYEHPTDLSKMPVDSNAEISEWKEADCGVNEKGLANITELVCAEMETVLSTYLRKRMTVKPKESLRGTLAQCLGERVEKHTYTIFDTDPHNRHGMVVIDLPFLHHTINLLYGGQYSPDEPIIEKPGKMGVLIAEKMADLILNAFTKACTDYGQVKCRIVKTVTLPTLATKLAMDDRMRLMSTAVFINEIETEICVLVKEEFIRELVPSKTDDTPQRESNFWRSAIETQVVDSIVEVRAVLPEVKIKLNSLMELKEGDLIPIGDPTSVFVCLNTLKLFSGSAGQANSKRMVKIIKEI